MEIANNNVIIVAISGSLIGLLSLKVAVDLANKLPAVWEWLLPHWYAFRARIGWPQKIDLSMSATFETVVENGSVYAYCPDGVPNDKGEIPYFRVGKLPSSAKDAGREILEGGLSWSGKSVTIMEQENVSRQDRQDV